MDQTDRQTDKNLDTSSQSFCIAEFPKSSFPISSARSMVPTAQEHNVCSAHWQAGNCPEKD